MPAFHETGSLGVRRECSCCRRSSSPRGEVVRRPGAARHAGKPLLLYGPSVGRLGARREEPARGACCLPLLCAAPSSTGGLPAGEQGPLSSVCHGQGCRGRGRVLSRAASDGNSHFFPLKSGIAPGKTLSFTQSLPNQPGETTPVSAGFAPSRDQQRLSLGRSRVCTHRPAPVPRQAAPPAAGTVATFYVDSVSPWLPDSEKLGGGSSVLGSPSSRLWWGGTDAACCSRCPGGC